LKLFYYYNFSPGVLHRVAVFVILACSSSIVPTVFSFVIDHAFVAIRVVGSDAHSIRLMSSFDEGEKEVQVNGDPRRRNHATDGGDGLKDSSHVQAGMKEGSLEKEAGHRQRSPSTSSSTCHDIADESNPKKVDIEATAGVVPDPAITKEGEDLPPDPNVVSWESPTDPENPINWRFRKRWTLIVLVSSLAFLAGLSSSFFAPSVPALMREFNSTNQTLASFVVTVFVLGLAAGPLAFGPLSELYGRLIVQHVGNLGFIAFTIACALATNLNMMIGFRFLQGVFASTPLTNGGAVISDVVHQEERGFALAIFTLGVLFGPVGFVSI
jgi:hypothetical protein